MTTQSRWQLLPILAAATAVFATMTSAMAYDIIAFDPIEPGGDWQMTLSPGNWYENPHIVNPLWSVYPSAGDYVLHANNSSTVYSGTIAIDYDAITYQSGNYRFMIDVSNWANGPLATFTATPTYGGVNLASDTTRITPPSSGDMVTYYYDVNVGPGDIEFGQSLGFKIDVPYLGSSANVAFDRFVVQYTESNFLFNDEIEPSGTWAGDLVEEDPSNWYYQPTLLHSVQATAGEYVVHANNKATKNSGQFFNVYENHTWAAGTYDFYLDVLNWDNNELSLFTAGPTTGGTQGSVMGSWVATDIADTPWMPKGESRTYHWQVTVDHGDALIGQQIGFAMDMLHTEGISRNVAFDNLVVEFDAADAPAIPLPLAGPMGLMILLISCRRNGRI